MTSGANESLMRAGFRRSSSIYINSEDFASMFNDLVRTMVPLLESWTCLIQSYEHVGAVKEFITRGKVFVVHGNRLE